MSPPCLRKRKVLPLWIRPRCVASFSTYATTAARKVQAAPARLRGPRPNVPTPAIGKPRRQARSQRNQSETHANIWKHMETYAKTRWIKMEDIAEYSSYTAHQSHQACHSAQKLTRNGITLAFPLSVLNLGQEPSHNVEHPRTLLNIHQTSGGQLGMSFCTIDHIKWCIMVSFCSTSVLPDSFL